jgi:hypothetical protein
MGFKTGDFPPVNLETFLDKPLFERIKSLALHWVDYGFGTPKVIHTTYVVKLLVLYLGIGLTLITMTSDVGPVWDVTGWWNEPIVYQKLVLWTMLLETVGVAGSWGPIAAKFKPKTGGILFWTRPGTIRMPPWPGKVPFTSGDSRTSLDVSLYWAVLASLSLPLVLPGSIQPFLSALLPENTGGLVAPSMFILPLVLLVLIGLRDKTIFIAARTEQYGPALLAFALLPLLGNGLIDVIILLKLLIVSVWIGAGVSKFGAHFANVVPPMVSNSPCIPRKLRRINYRRFPQDLRPSRFGSFLAHGGGTVVEIVTPVILLFSTNTTVTLACIVLMVVFHLFITSTFPVAVPLEWNLLFAYTAVFLFAGYPASNGCSLADASSPGLVLAAVVALFFFPVLGNLRPDLVAFTPAMRQYAGNWASALWAFQPGAEEKLNRITRPTANQVDQLQAMGYPYPVAEVTMQQTIAWRSMHSQGRGLFSLLINHVQDLDHATVREAEFTCNSLIGFNFGDGHLHDESLVRAVQKRCNFAPGELIVAWVESQPIHKNYQTYKVIDAALGVIETGTWKVSDAVTEQPWLPNGPIPTTVTWRHPSALQDGPTAAPLSRNAGVTP